eukprot:173461-Chlamydomonas_euryale.AAC.3
MHGACAGAECTACMVHVPVHDSALHALHTLPSTHCDSIQPSAWFASVCPMCMPPRVCMVGVHATRPMCMPPRVYTVGVHATRPMCMPTLVYTVGVHATRPMCMPPAPCARHLPHVHATCPMCMPPAP